jgi:hypothetical protein
MAVCFTPLSGIVSRSQALPSRANNGTPALQQTASLFDHHVDACKQRERNGDAGRLADLWRGLWRKGQR